MTSPYTPTDWTSGQVVTEALLDKMEGGIAAATAGVIAQEAKPATVNLTGAQTVAGVKTFSSSPIVPTPTTSTQAANKAYVDAAGGSVAWSAISGKPTVFPTDLTTVPAGYTHTVNEISGAYTRGTTRTDIYVRFRGFTDPKVTANSWQVGDEWIRPE